MHFLTFQIPDVITNVLSGKSDAGVLSACQLEKATASGLLDEGRLRVINEHHYDGLTCAHSSSLYPDLVFGALNFSQPTLLKDVSIALLTMPEEPTFSWQIAGKFDEVASLYATLQIGPWARQNGHLRNSFIASVVRSHSAYWELACCFSMKCGLTGW